MDRKSSLARGQGRGWLTVGYWIFFLLLFCLFTSKGTDCNEGLHYVYLYKVEELLY